MTLASQIASDLLDIQAVYLKPNDPFTWASGIKSPIYTDNRVTLSYPETRTLIENGFVEKGEYRNGQLITKGENIPLWLKELRTYIEKKGV